MIFKLIFIIIIFIFLIYSFIFYKIRKNILNKKIFDTRCEISNLGNNIALVGQTGDGKSTTGAGISLYLIEYIRYELLNRMNEIRIKLDHIDFNKVHNIFKELLIKYNNNLELATLNTISQFIDERMDLYASDFLNLDKKSTLLFKYILYYYRFSINNSYLYSKGYIFDRIQFKNSKLFDTSSIELCNVIEKHNFQINICDVIYDDEKSLERGNVYSCSKDVKLSGSKEFFALIRNMFLGLTYHISMKQESTDEVKQERVLINSTLQIFDRKTNICSFPLTRKLLNLFNKFILFNIKIYLFLKLSFFRFINIFKSKNKMKIYKFNEYVNIYINKPSLYRKIEHRIKYIEWLLISLSFIRVRLFKYYSSDDVAKRQKGTYSTLILYFPTYYCYGLINTYEYFDSAYQIFNNLRENSINCDNIKFNSNNRKERVYNIFKKR